MILISIIILWYILGISCSSMMTLFIHVKNRWSSLLYIQTIILMKIKYEK